MTELSDRIKELDRQAVQRTQKARARQFAAKASAEQHLTALIEKADAVLAEFCKLSAAARHHEKMMPLSCAIYELRCQTTIAEKRGSVR